MLKTYDVTCPHPDCLQEFEVEIDPETEEYCIECPECWNDFGWEYDPATDTLKLLPHPDADDEFEEDDDPDDEEEDELG